MGAVGLKHPVGGYPIYQEIPMPRSINPLRFCNARSFCTAALLTAMAGPAAGIDFNFTYDAANSTPPTSITDPNGTQLMSMMGSAATLWEDIIEDNWTINVAVRWQVPTLGNNFSGQMTLFQSHPDNVANDPAEQSGRVVWALIRMNPNRTWWVDPTPFDNSEFDMTQTLFRDLTNAQQTGFYSGNTPDLLEAGFAGVPNGSAPAIMQAAGTRDLLTVAVHELGHTIGVGGTIAARQEYGQDGGGVGQNDGDYDINPSQVNGNVFAAITESLTNGHINPLAVGGAPALMCRCGLGNIRRLPSAIDVLAGAKTANWTDLDIERKEFFGGVQWDNGFNWQGGAEPDPDDDVCIRHGAGSSVVLDKVGNEFIKSLKIDESSDLLITNGSTLIVTDTATVQDTSLNAGDSSLTVDINSELDATDLRVNDGGQVTVLDGVLDIEDLRIETGGLIAGNGVIQFDDPLINNGEIAAIQPFGIGISTLFINAMGGSPIDLDGTTGDGVITADFADISINAALNDDFDGTMNIGEGRFISMSQPWTLGPAGLLDMDGGNVVADRARLIGAQLTVGGGEVNASGIAHFSAPVTVETGSTVIVNSNAELEFNNTTILEGGDYNVGTNGHLEFNDTTTVESGQFTVAAGGEIEFNGTTTVDEADFIIDPTGLVSFDGPTLFSYNTAITSNGLIQQTGDATILGTMTVDGGTFDLDGYFGNTTINLGNSANPGTLILNVDAIDEVVNRFDGTINTEEAGLSGRLTVNLPGNDTWEMNGTLNLAGGSVLGPPTRIFGSKMIVTDTVNVASLGAGIDADTDFTSTSTVNTAAIDAELVLRGESRVFDGATFNGLGLIDNRAGADLTLRDEVTTSFVGLENSGILRIGNAPNLVGDAEVGRFTQNSAGTTAIQLGGAFNPAFTEQRYDILNVRGNAQLAGELELSFIGGYAPSLYTDIHDIIITSVGTVSDIFDTVDGVIYAAGLGLAVTYHNQSVRVTAALLGDLDFDGDVDGVDLSLSFGGFSGPNILGESWVTGDLDGDGDTDGVDLSYSFGSFTGPLTPANIPEPSTAITLLAAAACMIHRRRSN